MGIAGVLCHKVVVRGIRSRLLDHTRNSEIGKNASSKGRMCYMDVDDTSLTGLTRAGTRCWFPRMSRVVQVTVVKTWDFCYVVFHYVLD